MTERVLLIDYENVHEAGLKNLPAHDRILLFVGNEQRKANAAKPPADFVDAMMKAGKRLDLIPMTAGGKDNLDFHMAYYLGTQIAENPLAEYIVISDDADLDELLKHLKARGFNCRREESDKGKQAKAAAKKPSADRPVQKTKIVKPLAAKPAVKSSAHKAAPQKSATVREAREFLGTEKNPPKKRDALVHRLQSHFRITEIQGSALVEDLRKENFIKVDDKDKVSYLTKNTSPAK